MGAATAPLQSNRKESDICWYPVGANTTIWAGTLVTTRDDGYAYPARSGTATDKFLGVAYESVNNSNGAAGALIIRIEKTGTYDYNTTEATQASVGQPVYAADDSDVTFTALNNQEVGQVVEYHSATSVRVRIDLAVN